MPASTPHPQFSENIAIWSRIDDCLGGLDTIRQRGETYLPKLKGQDVDEYRRYLFRAVFFNASARTLEAMMGFLFRKPPTIEFPKSNILEPLQEDADLTGSNLMAYARRVAAGVGSKGRGLTLVDWSKDESRPYFAFYQAQNILNWRVERQGGNCKLVMLVLVEYHTDSPDGFEHVCSIRYRVCRINDAGIYEQTVYRGDQVTQTGGKPATTALPGTGNTPSGYDDAKNIVEGPTIIDRRGIPLDYIPAVFHNAEHPGECVGRAPMADITAVNISQYQTSADLEHGRHICGLPTPWAKCFGEDGAKLYLGMSHAWHSTDPAADCGFLEFEGTGLGELTKAMDEKQAMMAALGARLLEPRREGVESAEAIGLRASAETSTLARVGMLVSESLSEACRIAAWWLSADAELDDDIKFTLNKDFSSAAIDPTMLTAAVAAWQQNAISFDVMFHIFAKGELYPDGRTMEEEKDAIETNPPIPKPLPIPTAPPGQVPPKPAPGKPPTSSK